MPEVHAKLSASGSKRWMNCPRSVALESLFPEQSSEYAEEGTKAHSAAETILNFLRKNKTEELNKFTEALKKENPEMHSNVMTYVEFVTEKYQQMILDGDTPMMFIEERVNFSKYVPDGFGTIDCLLIGKRLIINDLKYGKGVLVEAEDNSQLRLYAVGALEDYGWIYEEIEEVEMNIIQPRLHSISTEIITTKALLKWAKETAKKAKMADENKGSYCPGADQCKFCKARALCKARANHMLTTIASILSK
jgi:hypothetical protein